MLDPSPRPTHALALALGLLLCGCYRMHGLEGEPDAAVSVRDAGRPRPDAGIEPRDAGPPADAGPRGDLWVLEPRAVAWTELRSCQTTEGSTVWLRVRVSLDAVCEHEAPIEPLVDHDMRYVSFRAGVWVERGAPCEGVTDVYEQDVRVEGLSTGGWSIEGLDSPIEIGPPPPPITCVEPRPIGEMCLVDCDCAGEARCLPMEGDAVCASFCERDCNAGLECLAGERCARSAIGLAAQVCAPLERDECRGDADCPAGMACFADGDGYSACEWTLRLNSGNRVLCGSNADCAEGLDCVEGEDGARLCEVRCGTARARCPALHACTPTSSFGGRFRWVCEFLGE